MIFQLSEEFNLPWNIIVAVAFGESSFLHRWHEKKCGHTKKGNFTCIYRGMGEMGVNLPTWEHRMEIDIPLLLTNLEYGYRIGVRVLKERQNNKDPCWVGTYNSFTPRFKRAYCKKILKIEAKIGRFIANEMLRLR